jgi:hypothetical protein
VIIRKLILLLGAILANTGALLIATEFPISIIGPLIIAAGSILILLSVFHKGKLLLGITSILLGILLVIAAVAILVILCPLLRTPYVLLFLGIALIVLGIILLSKLSCKNVINKKCR